MKLLILSLALSVCAPIHAAETVDTPKILSSCGKPVSAIRGGYKQVAQRGRINSISQMMQVPWSGSIASDPHSAAILIFQIGAKDSRHSSALLVDDIRLWNCANAYVSADQDAVIYFKTDAPDEMGIVERIESWNHAP